jgi:riboflavin synthase
MGVVHALRVSEGGLRLQIDPSGWGHEPAIGDSVAVNGCCLTLVSRDAQGVWAFDVIPQTLSLTVLGAMQPGEAVNLEAAARLDAALDGHLVQGHIDGVARVVARTEDATGDVRLRLSLASELLDLCVVQGSIALHGVSLTVAQVDDQWFEVALIPLTMRQTVLGATAVGDQLHVETDVLARHVARLLERRFGHIQGA